MGHFYCILYNIANVVVPIYYNDIGIRTNHVGRMYDRATYVILVIIY
jgi:hypothetical protein